MKRSLCTCALFALITMTAACSVKIFEDIGSDPHPPSFEITALELWVEPPPETETPADDAGSSAPGRTIAWDSGGFTLTPGQKFQIGVAYADAGADIVSFQIRDRDGDMEMSFTPDQAYFPGTSGVAFGPADGIELTGVDGRHRIELWAQDSHHSRSEKVEFVITFDSL